MVTTAWPFPTIILSLIVRMAAVELTLAVDIHVHVPSRWCVDSSHKDAAASIGWNWWQNVTMQMLSTGKRTPSKYQSCKSTCILRELSRLFHAFGDSSAMESIVWKAAMHGSANPYSLKTSWQTKNLRLALFRDALNPATKKEMHWGKSLKENFVKSMQVTVNLIIKREERSIGVPA